MLQLIIYAFVIIVVAIIIVALIKRL